MNSLCEVKDYFESLPETKRLRELEPYIEGSERIRKLFDELKNLQKQMVSSQEFHQRRQYESLKDDYEKKKEELLDIPFVEEYLELVDFLNDRLKEFSSLTEALLDEKING